MNIVQETEKIIAELPTEQAIILKYWLNEFEASRRYKQLKGYSVALEALVGFGKNNGNSLLN